ncbi:metallophosphoesterase family protein [Bacillus suaedaesalsae]|uniref:Phosphoesterase n=1 Tax=Bacillus suaedaesalsae TaxID=2810349 RepID=A0ABS2DIE3_9BACI|nr:metallophosphoesterase [Bacillus suaedaesalsae]MBM6618177.1 metallophosphoesterase [Bacillus suaedaesalsae]
MKVVVLSDTHMPKKAKQLPRILIEHLMKSDYIFHLGDWQTVDLYNELKSYATIIGVAGNVDNNEIVELLGYHKIIEIKGYTFGLVHGHQGKGRTTEERALNTFPNKNVDVILFGHSHIPVLKKVNNSILFNPGSPTDKRRQSHFSFGIIEINETIILQHIFFD